MCRTWISVVFVPTLAVGLALTVGSSVAGTNTGAADTALPALPTKAMVAGDRARITAITRELLASDTYAQEVPGVVVGVWSPRDGVYRASFGVADLKSRARPQRGSSLRIGSVSKTFTATVVLQLVDEGKLSLNGPVRRYVPSLARKYPAIGRRTVAQLLGMRSGLPDYANAAVAIQSRSPRRVWTSDELIALGMRSGRVKPAGGTNAVYSNTNYVVLGRIAEAVTSTPFDRLVRERFLRPLGLGRTVYPAPTQSRLPAPFTHGYVGPAGVEEIVRYGGRVKPGADVTTWNPSLGNAAGMIVSTIDDLARWGNGLFGNALLSPTLRRQRLAMHALDAESSYGLGIMTLRGGRWAGHSGGIPGWSTWALKDRQTGTVVVTSVNACCGGTPGRFTVDLLRKLYPDSFVSGPLLKAGTPYALSDTTSFTPPSGWRVDAGISERGSLTAAKPGVLFDIADALVIAEGQSIEFWATLLHDADAMPGTTVGALTPFATTSGLAGYTWTTRSVTKSTQDWMVTNGRKIARLTVTGSASAVGTVSAELDRMARSITMRAP